ncbi:MAG: cyclic nucleotide-binding domain-containing protein [Cyanobacteria bacterium NC_groundwater_1444_Ag_S-0.65um_54_12]|nr:cyclic nucleotide-binding domain-containing protein [Cyanobacteria bacterium NC_groundwater_1444_Ag_S-0.65um_54_12]
MTFRYEWLKKEPAWQNFSDAEIETFLAMAQQISVKAGERVIRAGDQADAFFLIVSGKLTVTIEAKGKASPLAQLGPGQLVGEMGLIYSQPIRQADVFSATASELLRFDYTAYKELGQRQPGLAKKFHSNLGKIVASRIWTTLPQQASNARVASTPAGNPGSAPSAKSPIKPDARVGASSGSTNRDIIRRAQIFANLNEEEFSRIEAIAQVLLLKRGEMLMQAGDPADSFFLISKGQVEVQIAKEQKVFPLARLGSGQVIGEMALVYRQTTRSATVIAVDDCKLLRFDFGDYQHLVANEPAIGKKLRGNFGRVAASRSWSLPEVCTARSLPRPSRSTRDS